MIGIEGRPIPWVQKPLGGWRRTLGGDEGAGAGGSSGTQGLALQLRQLEEAALAGQVVQRRYLALFARGGDICSGADTCRTWPATQMGPRLSTATITRTAPGRSG